MASVEALLSLPTDEIRAFPLVVTEEDVFVIFRELQTILRKCLYAVRYALAIPFAVWLHLLLQPAVLESDDFLRALLTHTEEGPCINLLADICGALLARGKCAFRRAINIEVFFDLIQRLCGSSTLKEPLGSLLMPCLLAFIYDAVEVEDDYRQCRLCASVLITLIRASKANKNRMSVECGHLGEALAKSSDIFFQMQCVEIIFRLYTHNRTVLATSTLPEFLKKSIAELLNDASLLTHIKTLLDTYNIDYGTAELIQFTALFIEAGKEEVCGHTDMYFSPLIFVIMIPGFSGDNITVPYEHIRSVKLSKDRKLCIRLHVIPGRLSHVMNQSEGKDTLMISLTQSTFAAIRASKIYQWITDRKRRVPISLVYQQLETSTLIPTSTSTAAIATSTRATVPASYSGKESPKDAAFLSKGKDFSASMPTSSCNASAHVSPKRPGGGDQQQQRQQSQKVPRADFQHALSENEKQLITETTEDIDDDASFQLHAATTQKAVQLRQSYQRELQRAVDFAQEKLEKMRRVNARERDDFGAFVRDELTTIRQAEAKVKAHAAECVQLLNQELSEIQALGELLRVGVDKLREDLSAALQRSEFVEEEALVELKTMVDGEIKSMEETLLNLMLSTNPLSFLTTYLSKKLESGTA